MIKVVKKLENLKYLQEPYKKANRKFHLDDTVITLSNGTKIGDGSLTLMAGPCSVESAEQVTEIAKAVKASGANVLRGGAFKPRTSPYSFQGLKAEGLELLLKAKEETGLDKLEDSIKNLFFTGNITSNEEIYITNARHKSLLNEALNSLRLVSEGINDGVSEDFLTIDLMNAYEKLGLIIGEAVEDDLADQIFSKFCMGK